MIPSRPLVTFFVGLLATVALRGRTATSVTHPPGRYLDVSGHQIWYESEGRGEPLLLLPGGPGASHDYFHPWFSALRDRARIIYVDPFGTGRSGRARALREYSLRAEIEDIEAIRQALHLGRINLFGHSYGGIVALSYALKYPGSLRRLIVSNTLVSAGAWQLTTDHANAETRLFFPESTDSVAALKARGLGSEAPEVMAASPNPGQVMAHLFFYDRSNLRKLFSPDSSFNPEVMTAIGGQDMDDSVGGELAHFDFRESLRSVSVPILILAGRADGVVLPRLARELWRASPQATFVMFEHSGHYPFIEEPQATMQAIGAFLKTSH
jgi:proline iminopeptidase